MSIILGRLIIAALSDSLITHMYNAVQSYSLHFREFINNVYTIEAKMNINRLDICRNCLFQNKIAEKTLSKDSEILKNIAKGLRKRANEIYLQCI